MPKQSFKAVETALMNKDFAPLYFFHGEEPYYIDRLTELIEEGALPEEQRSFNQTILYGGDVKSNLGAVIDAAMRLPMMAERQVIIVKEAQQIKSWTILETYLKNPNPATLLAFAHKNKKIDGRSAFAKALSKNAVVVESNKVRDYELINVIPSIAQELGLSIDMKAAQMMAEYIGSDLSRLYNEIKKLKIVVSDGAIMPEHVEEHIGISKDYNVFELQNAMLEKNPEKAFRILNYFDKNPKAGNIVFITATMYSLYSKLYAMFHMPSATDKEISSAVGINPYFTKNYKRAMQQYSLPSIKKNIELLAEYDLKSKGVGNHGNSQSALLQEMTYKLLM